jgi:hypothetical protein
MNKNILWTEIAMFAIAMCAIKFATSHITVEIVIGYMIGRIIGFLLWHR